MTSVVDHTGTRPVSIELTRYQSSDGKTVFSRPIRLDAFSRSALYEEIGDRLANVQVRMAIEVRPVNKKTNFITQAITEARAKDAHIKDDDEWIRQENARREKLAREPIYVMVQSDVVSGKPAPVRVHFGRMTDGKFGAQYSADPEDGTFRGDRDAPAIRIDDKTDARAVDRFLEDIEKRDLRLKAGAESAQHRRLRAALAAGHSGAIEYEGAPATPASQTLLAARMKKQV